MYRIIKISFLFLLISSVQGLFAQVSADKIPNGIAIQSVARDASGNAASNRNIFLKVELRQGTATGESVLIETHSVTSNDEGIFNFYIGQGTRVSGTNSLIFLDWKGKIYFLNIKMAIEPSLPTPGWVLEKEYVDLGTSQIWSVPYAFTSYRSVIADSAMNFAGIVSGANGGTGISNAGRKIILGGDLEIKGTGNLTFKTSGISVIELPTSGKVVTTIGADTLFNKTFMSPLLIGTPKSVTPNVGSNDNSIATTNFVNVLLASDSNSVNQRLSQLANSSKDSIDKKLNIKDTALMLLPYLKYTKKSDTTYADLNIKANTIIDSNLTVKGNLILNKGLKFNDSLLVSSGARIDSSLILKGKLLLKDSLVASGNVLIKGKVQFDSTLTVNKLTLLRDSLNVKGKVQLDSNLTVNKVTSLNDSLFVKGNSLFDSNMTVGKDLEVKGNLILNTGLKFNDSLIVSKGARIDSSLILKGKLLLRDSLVASGNGLIKGNVQFDSTLTVNKLTVLRDSLNVKGKVQLDSNLIVNRLTSLNDSLYVKGNSLFDNNMTVGKDLEVKGNLILNTGLKFNDSLIVSKGARIDSSLILKGKLLLRDSLVASGNGLIKGKLQLDSTLTVNRVTSLNDSLYVKGNSLFDNNMTVGKDLEVKGNLILNTGLKFNDSLIVTKGARIDSSLILKGKLLLRDSLVASGNGLIKGRVQFDSTLTVNKAAFLRDSLFVKGQVKLDSNIYIRGNFRLGGDLILDSGLFRRNFIVNLGEGVKFGRYNYKDTIQAKGKSIDEVFYDILTDITHPLYVAPTLKISKLLVDTIAASSTNKILKYEIGKNLGSLKFSSNFVQNNAGPRLTTTFKKNSTNFIRTDSTDIISNLTDTLYYTSTIAYDSGAILTNRIGVLDTLGRINRGSIQSDTIAIFPVSNNYWGYLQNADPSYITDSLLLGKDITINNKGFSEFASSPAKSSFSIPIAGGEKYIYYAYPAKFPDLTSLMVGPFESIDAFTKIIRNVVNAQGYSQPYKIYVSANNFSDKVEKIIIN